MSDAVLRASRLALASLIAVALASQLLIGLSRDSGLTVIRFFSFFTVLSNTAAVVMLTMLATRPRLQLSALFAGLRGAVTVYMAVTGVVYAVLLAPQLADVAVPEPWIDWVIHVIAPVAVVADWVAFPPPAPPHPRTLWTWLVFPALYLAYSLVRGPAVDWYPYPFLDPANGGYLSVALWSLVVLAVILAIAASCLWWPRRRARPAPVSG